MKYTKLLIIVILTLLLVSCQKTPIQITTHAHTFIDGVCSCGETNPIIDIRPTYEVTFVDKYGEVIEVVKVKEGETAIPSKISSIKFHEFVGWDQDVSCVKENMTVNALYNRDKTNLLNNTPEYWIRQVSDKYNVTKTIMTLEEIKAYNKNVISDKTNVVDVLSVDQTVTRDYVRNLIESYSNIDKYVIYDNNTKEQISNAEKTNILNNRNLDNINLNVNVKFGLICDFAWMRTYPTNNYSSTYDKDRFQETSLNVGEEVAIYHTSSDGLWYFVQATNYYGWVESKYIGIASYEEVKRFVDCENILVVISDYVKIFDAHVRMGQAFPLVSNNNLYVIEFPTRGVNGNLELVQVELAKDDNFNVGYLDYNYENLFKQAFKLLGIIYSWGDKEKDGRDCSSTQNSIYASFGFRLPRNTNHQNAIPTYGKSFSNITTDELKDNYKPGTLIFSSGHVMMYIGENHQGYSYILHNTSAGTATCITQKVSAYGINRIIGTLKLQ